MKDLKKIGDIAKQILKEAELNLMKEYSKGHYYKCDGLPGLVELVKVEDSDANIKYRGNVIKVKLSKLSKI